MTEQGKQRWAAGVEYLGTDFSGWQAQPHAPSVQQVVEDALGFVAGEPVTLTCAGRTDTGVHGLCQVVHFDSAARRNPKSWVLGANTKLPPSVSLRWAQPMGQDFHARFGARLRTYRYIIHNAKARSAAFGGHTAWWHYALDAQAMHRAAQTLLGEHDFSAFRAAECQAKSAVRTLHAVSVWRSGDFVSVQVTANAFLHHMVRNIVGTLMQVGQGKQAEAWVADILRSQDRKRAGMTAPAGGLYFAAVHYPSEHDLDIDSIEAPLAMADRLPSGAIPAEMRQAHRADVSA